MKEIRRRGGVFRTVMAFSLGATVGSMIALLYAPASGKVTRRRLVFKARTLKRAAARRLGQTTRVLASRAEHVREAATEWIADHIPHSNGKQTMRRREIRHAMTR